ncbi:MAG TPA: histidinol dehydrogenase [Terriglobales bacterium]|nr:histidinol dehydrogenase [Terriglobales bacterium]
MRIVAGGRAAATVARLADRGAAATASVEPAVRRIVAAVRRGGDRALVAYARKFDGLAANQALRVSSDELQAAWRECPADLRAALRAAARNIRRFAQWQRPAEWRREIAPGVCVGQLVRPLESVGCYVPGGRYPLPSTLLMTVVPAQVAGVRRIAVVSPRPAKETLAAAAMLGVKEFYRIGGAQAIAALAYGTETVSRVAKIVGPGNLYVTAAKKIVAFDCGIDFLAGPTEALLVRDDGDLEFIAADLVAQAEHDPATLPALITCSRALAQDVAAIVRRKSRENSVARMSLRRNGVILLARSPEQAMQFANQLAPEHVSVSADALPSVENAGSIFVGDYSAQAFGDYGSGPNHVLPTGGIARSRGGLSVLDFVKLITVQEISREGTRSLRWAGRLGQAEGLRAHAESIEARCARA